MDYPDAVSEPSEDFRPPLARRLHALWRTLEGPTTSHYDLTRWALLRAIGAIYAVAFLVLALQLEPLLSSEGLLPIERFVPRARAHFGGLWGAFAELPSVWWFIGGDGLMQAAAWLGFALAAAVALGLSHAIAMAALWALYLSFVHMGQIFYGYGWETLLCEAGFLAIFLAPWRTLGPLPASPPPRPVIWLYRWLALRVMLGAGLIKLRGDPCWVELTCLEFHYETQPNPHPLSWLLHQAPPAVHALGGLVNHLAELLLPLWVFGPRRLRIIAGVGLVGFQGLIIASGNLSFLNWLTAAICLACLDDAALLRALPRRWRARWQARVEALSASPRPLGWPRRVATALLVATVGLLSIQPTLNLLSPGQRMNSSFDALRLVNTYGAFGSVGRERHEIVLEGTADDPGDPAARWEAYALPCQPGPLDRAPCLITPYHLRLDWQIWFAAMGRAGDQPWLMHLVFKLLRGESTPKALLAHDPFPETPPRAIRARLFRYRFTEWGEPGWWRRSLVGVYLAPKTADHPGLRRYLVLNRLIDDG